MSKTAILIVNGPSDTPYGTWIEMCLSKIVQYTDPAGHHVFLWNNNTHDIELTKRLQGYRNLTLVQYEQSQKLTHFHREPLQRLYQCALREGLGNEDYVFTLDNDSFPIKTGWLPYITSQLNEKTVLAGVWRDELKKGIKPYVHPSGLCISVDYIKSRDLRFDTIQNGEFDASDTLSHFTDQARADERTIFKLRRSNKNNYHRLLGGIYGDTIYHHGAGSRNSFKLWDERHLSNLKPIRNRNRLARDVMTKMLFLHYDTYIAWLRNGKAEDKRVKRLFQVLNWQMRIKQYVPGLR
ncbi:hypothetical protein [Desulfofustis glycolicus]|uniref:Glycosyl transferase family 2 n=1 Tax=Desulfofustis glycolicus DSM 9705 TaxID=1121409 RepID=A0A1M5Y6C4_9BACT|nr:hypothetical protein [Desulfofustis glycolicus]MCB2216849.1 hypothetical protein [Desulfobulbaceae bacterium]SHI07625.1 hypothetical protein SAMN02745124_03678 [Desulfofustis glycolicus DSM 9705]